METAIVLSKAGRNVPTADAPKLNGYVSLSQNYFPIGESKTFFDRSLFVRQNLRTRKARC